MNHLSFKIIDNISLEIIDIFSDKYIRELAREKNKSCFDVYNICQKEIMNTGFLYEYNPKLKNLKIILKNRKKDENYIYFDNFNEYLIKRKEISI